MNIYNNVTYQTNHRTEKPTSLCHYQNPAKATVKLFYNCNMPLKLSDTDKYRNVFSRSDARPYHVTLSVIKEIMAVGNRNHEWKEFDEIKYDFPF